MGHILKRLQQNFEYGHFLLKESLRKDEEKVSTTKLQMQVQCPSHFEYEFSVLTYHNLIHHQQN